MPEEKEIVVTNTTPIITLSLVGQLRLLEQLYGEVLVPPAVQAEVLAGGRGRVGVIVSFLRSLAERPGQLIDKITRSWL